MRGSRIRLCSRSRYKEAARRRRRREGIADGVSFIGRGIQYHMYMHVCIRRRGFVKATGSYGVENNRSVCAIGKIRARYGIVGRWTTRDYKSPIRGLVRERVNDVCGST